MTLYDLAYVVLRWAVTDYFSILIEHLIGQKVINHEIHYSTSLVNLFYLPAYLKTSATQATAYNSLEDKDWKGRGRVLS